MTDMFQQQHQPVTRKRSGSEAKNGCPEKIEKLELKKDGAETTTPKPDSEDGIQIAVEVEEGACQISYVRNTVFVLFVYCLFVCLLLFCFLVFARRDLVRSKKKCLGCFSSLQHNKRPYLFWLMYNPVIRPVRITRIMCLT